MWDPFRDIDRFLNGLNNTIGNAGGPYSLLGNRRWFVAANVVEDDKAYTVEVDVPGLKQDDVKVEVEDRENRICISGNRSRPSYYRYLQEDRLRGRGDGGRGSNRFEHWESTSTVTTIDEKGNVTSTTTTNNNPSDDDQHKGKSGSSLLPSFGVKKSDDTSATTTTSTVRPLLIEKDFGEFERCFAFPERIAKDSTVAEIADGVLTLTVQKAYPGSKGSVTVPVKGK